MANQLTTRIDVENDTAAVSMPTVARSRILAFAAGAGSQFLAFAAVAQPAETNPIFDPASSDPYILAAGLIIGAGIGWYGCKATSKKSKD